MASEVRDVLFPYWHWSGWLWPSGILGLLLAWSISSIVFFGRDFIHCVRSNQPVQ
jgi:integral membrane sensor domain MASE1